MAMLRDVYETHRADLGDEDAGLVFEREGAPLRRVDVLIYRARGHDGATAFRTIGMSILELPATPGPGNGGRAELQLIRRGMLGPADEHAVARRLADVASYPFVTGRQLSWGHLAGLGKDFPTFPACDSIFVSGPLAPGARGWIDTGSGQVRLLNVVPITARERALGVTLPPIKFAEMLLDTVDLYAARP